MRQILGLLIVGLVLVGCDPLKGGSGYEEAEQKAKDKDVQAYLYSLPENDMNHPDYTLPDDPGSAGDDTLLGIDSNNNGIRDDIEIYIYNRYKDEPQYRRTLTAIASQYARATQKILINPENAYENETYRVMDDALHCKSYFDDKYTRDQTFKEYLTFSLKYNFYTPKVKDRIFNTKERLQEYFKFNKSLGGHIFNSGESTRDRCHDNIDKFGE